MLLACTNLQAQQKAMYTQYMFNGLALNPAYSATDEALTITSLYRQQWVGLKGAPNTQTLSIHTPVGESNTSVGASIIRDQIGEVITEKGVYLTVAQRVPVGEQSYLAVGFNGGLSSYSAEYSMNYAGSPQSTTDPVFEDQSQMRANFGLGVVFFGPKYYVGLSSPHFYYRPLGEISNLASSTTYRPHYILQGGYIAELSDMIKFKPHLIINYVNGSPVLIDMNASVLFAERLWLGGSYRSKDAFNAIAQLYVLPTLAVGYSYDFTSTKLSRIEKGSHEISLKFRIPVKGRDFPQCYF
ncbi:type IX secretion system membrane protein PorP/SprF [Paradesertivirga mongoliensis]|uniref:Type IX secretion system membrane protein PorP/SprF n=1 Tax=Paradesertivirga mongoliensis TaxID=2100740 RepID=A0ABW4ZG63_9SPHI|nr:type IX secretion system membrane protein PorP/SprF [Pedobacter mongoliensis]